MFTRFLEPVVLVWFCDIKSIIAVLQVHGQIRLSDPQGLAKNKMQSTSFASRGWEQLSSFQAFQQQRAVAVAVTRAWCFWTAEAGARTSVALQREVWVSAAAMGRLWSHFHCSFTDWAALSATIDTFPGIKCVYICGCFESTVKPFYLIKLTSILFSET